MSNRIAPFRKLRDSDMVRVTVDEMVAAQKLHDAHKDDMNHHCWLCPTIGQFANGRRVSRRRSR